MVEILRSALLGGIPHGFSTRNGLVADDILPGAAMATFKQVHSPDVVVMRKPLPDTCEADAMVTDQPGLVLRIITADCAPVLFADAEAGVVGAAHAGWRGAHGGVIANTVAAMERLGAQPSRIIAAIGPTIAQASYEVDARFRDQFADSDDRFFAPGADGHWQFDLPQYVADRLRQAGVNRIDDLACDTYADESRFFSYRRATHRGEETGGRQLSMIAIP